MSTLMHHSVPLSKLLRNPPLTNLPTIQCTMSAPKLQTGQIEAQPDQRNALLPERRLRGIRN